MNVIKTYNSQYTHLSTGLTCRVRREKECVLCVDIKSQKTLLRQENIASAINLFRGQREKKIKNRIKTDRKKGGINRSGNRSCCCGIAFWCYSVVK